VPEASEGLAWEPDEDFLRNSNVARFAAAHGFASLEELHAASVGDMEWFWSAVIDDLGLDWIEPPARMVDESPGRPWARWFPGGVTNATLWCVERHDPANLAYVWEGEEGAVRTLTFGALSALVSQIAGGLRQLGVRRGDRVGIYLPPVPEAMACAFACAKLGAVYLPMFSGFAEDAVAARLRDAEAKVLIAADGAYRRGRVIDMRSIAERAVQGAPSVEHLVVWPRLGNGNWNEFLDAEPVLECEPVAADHPFFIGYTSGTTGRPKGAVHGHAGFPLKVATEMRYQCDQREGDLLFWMTDPGWVMSPITFLGAAMAGQPVFLYDGTPDFPSHARVAELLDRHGIAIFGVAPTFVRALMARDDHAFSTDPPVALRVLASSGEPWNDAPWRWFFERVGGGRCPIVNISGGTEAGVLLGVHPIRGLKPCSFNGPSLGVEVGILNASGQPAATGEVGELVVTKPWPGRTLSFWNDDARYLETYWSRWPGVWAHGDWASRDADGFWFLHGRSDDTMNVAGKRVGPAEVESVLVDHAAVAEAAVVGIPHEVKGEAIWCFVVVPGGADGLEEDLRGFVAERMGKAFTPERVIAVAALPRTRSAKVLRRAIRAAVTGEDAGDLTSLENPEAVAEIRAAAGEAPRV
jgi:acetyl-CoA synthetase